MWADLDLTVQVPVFILIAFLEYDPPLGRGTPRILSKILNVRMYKVF